MAGHTLALRNTLEVWAKAAAEDMDVAEPTALDWVCWRVMGGATLRELTAELETQCKMLVGRAWLSAYLRRLYPEYEQRIRDARRIGAQALVDDAIAIIDDADFTNEALRKAQLQSEIRKWTAERYARDEFAGQSRTTVNVNIGSMHLDALRKRNVEVSIAAPGVAALPNGDVEDAECVFEETSAAASAAPTDARESNFVSD